MAIAESSRMKSLGVVVVLAVSAAFSVGCSSVVCEDGVCCEDECCEGDGCTPPVSHGVATPWESFGGSRGPAPSGTLLIKLTSGEGFCSEPWVSDLTCDGAWEVDIPLPPALQFVGATASLADLEDLGGATFRRGDPAEGDVCQMSEGALTGELEVVSLSEFDVTVRVTTTEPALEELEEQYTVPRCQNPELPQQAVALLESAVPTFDTFDQAGFGAEPEPAITEPLHVFIDQTDPALGAVCEDPFGTGQCEDRLTLRLVLGIDHQYPGTYTLADGITVSSLRSTAGDVCLPTEESWLEATVEVLAITPALVHVRVTGEGVAVADAIATRCF